MASLATDLSALKRAQKAAQDYLSSAPDPHDPTTEALLQRVHALFDSAEDTFN